ncbi:MAG: hypothetical protein [Olavius algarvensis Delta 4 endosymbiont]|nr:MAG: hypothetical protein [Olavius algarvensis Delta 4 endosymbiont]
MKTCERALGIAPTGPIACGKKKICIANVMLQKIEVSLCSFESHPRVAADNIFNFSRN